MHDGGREMVMDGNLNGYYSSTNGTKLGKDSLSILTNRNLTKASRFGDALMNQNPVDILPLVVDLNSNVLIPYLEASSNDDCDFNDVVLKYISQMLMEEDMEEKACMFQESAALQAKEKSFYEVLGEDYPPLPDTQTNFNLDKNSQSLIENHDENYGNYYTSENTSRRDLFCPSWSSDARENEAPDMQNPPFDAASQSISQSSFNSSHSSSSTVVDGPVDSPMSTLRVPDIFIDTQSIMQFKKGFEEASRFLPHGNGLFVDLGNIGYAVKEDKEDSIKHKEETKGVVCKVERKHESKYSLDGSKGKKNPLPSDFDVDEGRSNKQSAVYAESPVRSEMFDMVLLCNGGQGDSALRAALQNGMSKSLQENGQSKGSNGGNARGKRQETKKDVVDLRTLLTLCAQAVAADDRRTANDFLKQIRKHSSSTGDGMQRLAHYFADGLEARMAGSGTQVYTALITMPTSAADVLKAYHLFLAACPFRKISNFFSNKTIMNVTEKATTLHIIDFGILYGFQWPSLIQRLSSRLGGPPKLRITGIDFPHPGFRPSERVEETGCRLANYAETFKVPFEFNAIAQKWETIQLEDLKIEKDEVLVVNCLYRFRNLLDETVMVDSPRNIVVNLIKKMNPDVYIQGIVNGAYNAPFFITRFREALFHFSSVFDMLEVNIPREIHERMLIEKTIFGREAMNVIACESAERIERPETYKNWQIRNLRAGFRQLPLNEEIVKMAKDRVNSIYHKDFVIDEDGHWLLQGWKGRIMYALSSWRPAY